MIFARSGENFVCLIRGWLGFCVLYINIFTFECVGSLKLIGIEGGFILFIFNHFMFY